MPSSPYTSSPRSSDDYSDSSSISSTRSIIKPSTPATTSPSSRTVAFTEVEDVNEKQDAGWKIPIGQFEADTVNEVPVHYSLRIASSQGSASEQSAAGEAVVLRCTQFVRTGSCAFGDDCKYSHASLPSSQYAGREHQSKSSKNKESYLIAQAMAIQAASDEGTTDYPTIPQEAKRSIDHLLRKTKMCHAFNKGKCDYGYACRFAHIAGHDAFQILSKANAARECPFQTVLGQCSTKGKGCYFKHSPVKRPINTINAKGKKSSNTIKVQSLQVHAEGEIRASGDSASGSEGSTRSQGSGELDDELFAKEINDLIDFREGLKDVHVS